MTPRPQSDWQAYVHKLGIVLFISTQGAVLDHRLERTNQLLVALRRSLFLPSISCSNKVVRPVI